jgi:hypothetical protein
MENKVPLTLSEFRVIHLTPEGFFKLFFGLFFLLLLNSCSKEATLDEVRPASVEATSELKDWATKNDKLNQANLIEWDYFTPITLSDSIKGYSAPVKTASGYKEFIAFEIGGKRYGWYKSYMLLNNTDMEIVIQSVEGKTLRSGFIRKKSASTPKGKVTPMREMNFDTPIDWMLIEEILGILLENVTISAPRLNQGGGGFYFGNTRFDINTFNYYFEAGFFNAGNYGGGNSQYGFVDYNYTQIEDNLTNSCFKSVLNELRTKNIYGIVGDMVREFDSNKMKKLNFDQAKYLEKNGKPLNAQYNSVTNTITLSESELENASKEFIACVIVHEMFHACIKLNTENLDHTLMYNQYVESAGQYLNALYGIDKISAENLFLDGLKDAKGYNQVSLFSSRWLEVKNAISVYKYNFANLGHYCN